MAVLRVSFRAGLRWFGQARHGRGIDDHVPLRTPAQAFAAHSRVVAQRDMNHAALAAVHGIELEILSRAVDFLGRRQRAQAQFLDAQHAVIVGIEGKLAVVLRRNRQRLHRDVLERQQQFGAIGQQQVYIVAREPDNQFRIFDFGVRGIPCGNLEIQFKSPALKTGRRNCSILGPVSAGVYLASLKGYFLLLLFLTSFAGTGTSGLGTNLFNSHCCAIPTKLPVSQYNTSPLEA